MARLAYNENLVQENKLPVGEEESLALAQPANKLLSRKRKKSKHPLRDLRLQRGYTLEELAALTELSPSYLSRLESGSRRLNADILSRLSDVLSCHPGDLLSVDGIAPGRFTSRMTHQPLGANENPNPFAARHAPQDLPLYQLAAGGQALTVLNPEAPTEWVARPAELLGVSGALSFTVQGSGVPFAYQAGDRLFAHPTKPLTPHCRILAITNDYQVYTGEFTGWRSAQNDFAAPADRLSFRTFVRDDQNNIREETHLLTNDRIKAVYRIIGAIEAA